MVNTDLVLVAGVRQRADDGKLVGVLRQQRHAVADVDAGHARPDRRKVASDAGRGVGLHVPQVLLRRAAPEEDQDARLRSAGPRWGAFCAFGTQESGKGQPAKAVLAEAQHEVATVEHGGLRGVRFRRAYQMRGSGGRDFCRKARTAFPPELSQWSLEKVRRSCTITLTRRGIAAPPLAGFTFPCPAPPTGIVLERSPGSR